MPDVVTIFDERPKGGRLNQAIANLVVRSQTQHFGRGPAKAHAFFREHVVVVLMEGGMTPAERALVDSGQEPAVHELRSRLQTVIRDDVRREVEQLTGCTVMAFMSASHIDPDLAVEVFVLDRPVQEEAG